MNFLFIITNLAGGGAEKIMLTLAHGLSSKGHHTELILLENHIEHIIPTGLQVTPLTETCSKGWLSKRYLARKLKQYVRSRSSATPDLTISALPFANEVAIQAHLPNLWCRIDNTLGVEIDKLHAKNPAKAKRRLKRYRKLYHSRSLIAISHGMVEDLQHNISLNSTIELIPNPFNFKEIRASITAPSGSIPDTPYVIHVGRFNEQKRHDILLDAWSKVDTDRKLILLTANNPSLQAMINERGLENRTKIVGFQANPYPWIAGADLLVLSSDHEGLPGVLIESLICQTPAVSTDCPSGPREILSDFPNCLVPRRDVDTLATTISQILSNPPDMSRADISNYDIESVLNAYEQLAQR